MQIKVTAKAAKDAVIYAGGPVQQERGFVIHNSCGQWDSSIQISEGLSLTTSRDILEAIASGTGPTDYLVALGYAGWGAGQLEREVSNNFLAQRSLHQTIFYSPHR